jgi:predicted RNA-binding protein with PUA-like domain
MAANGGGGYWLMKTEPDDYSWDRLVAEGETEWTGVRNHQAARNMRAMQAGDRAFFYRSVVEPAIVGVMEVSRTWYPCADDPTGKFCRVKVRPVAPAPSEVPLRAIRADPRLAELALIRQSRLSVMPVAEEHWRILCGMAGLPAA